MGNMSRKNRMPKGGRGGKPQTKPPYGNCVMLSPDGTILCRCDNKKANWYLSRGLAEVTEEDPLTFKLRFIPRGNGHASLPYYVTAKDNMCVCCGALEFLTKHHCVPRCFRRHFPDKFKSHSCHDIVLLCVACHARYEPLADELKWRLLDEYDIPRHVANTPKRIAIMQVCKAANALLQHGDKIPVDRAQVLSAVVGRHLGKEVVTLDDLQEIQKLDLELREQHTAEDCFGRRVVEQLSDIYEFVKMWRNHFVTTMQPKFLPAFWSIDHEEEEWDAANS